MTDSAITKQQQAPLAGVTSPMGLLQLAIEREGSIDVIERLAKLQMEMMDREARLAYINAFEEFKRNAPTIVKDSEIVIKKEVMGKFAKLDQICDKLIPALLAVGITHRWKATEGENGRVICTCYLRHRLGHEEQGATFGAPPETSGFKNAVQAVGSTASYLERYTFVASCGLAIKGTDNIDNPPNSGKQPGVLDEREELAHLDNIRNANDAEELRKMYMAAQKAADATGDTKSTITFADAKNKRYRELQAEGRI